MNHIRRTLALAAAALALGAASPGTTLAADPPGKGITINIGYFPVVSPVPIMRSQRQLEDKGYTVNWVPINQGLPGAASAVAAGQLDIAWGNSISAVVIFFHADYDLVAKSQIHTYCIFVLGGNSVLQFHVVVPSHLKVIHSQIYDDRIFVSHYRNIIVLIDDDLGQAGFP